MSVYSTKELHNCKVESEAAGINNGSSFKKKKGNIFRKHSFHKRYYSLHNFTDAFKYLN